MSELLDYNLFNRRYGLWRQSHLETPVVYPIAKLSLPKRALLHFAPVNGVTLGPSINDPMLRHVPGVIYVYHQIKYDNPIGGPQKNFTNPEGMITDFRRKNRAFRPLKNLERLELDDRVLPVFNYALLSHLVRYPATFRANYYMWFNVTREVIYKINEIGITSRRQQFIEIDLPEVMPSLTHLRELMARQSTDTMKHFGTPEALTLADLFMWAGPQRKDSLFGKIDPKFYGKVNLIFRRLNGWVTVNMKWLDDLIISSKEELAAYAEAKKAGKEYTDVIKTKGNDAKIFQLKFLKLLNKIHQATSPIETPTKEEVAVAQPVGLDEPDNNALDQVHLDMTDDEVADEDFHANDDLEIISKLEKELEDLETARADARTEEVFDEEGNVIDTKTIDIDVLQTKQTAVDADGTAMLLKADELSAKGFLTRAEAARLQRLSEAHKNIADPYGSGQSLVEASKLTEEDTIVNPKPYSDGPMVLDKSMLESRVDAMDRQYVEKCLRKDILRCVLAIQKSPVAITGYTVDYDRNAVTDNEIHTIKITPAVGTPSTLKIPIPRIRPDGTYLYKGTEYRMRKQRVDLPIRKISPIRVALSSYYSKVFVERSQRKVFDQGKWFIERLKARAQDANDPFITKGVLSTVVDYKLNVPLIYTTISESLASFTAGKLNFWFDHKRRVKQFDFSERELKFEKDGWVLVGRGPEGALLMDHHGMIYTLVMDVKGGTLKDVGSIYDLTGIPIEANSTPVPMAEVKIYSKTIPVGFVLAYLLGFENLLKLTKVKYRRVLMGERANLASNEFGVRFKNETFVFSRDNQMTAMIFSGFNLFHEALKAYNSTLFEEKDVYAAVLDRSRIGSRYLRELDSLNTLFVDPITEDLLEWMGEPKTFTGLLIRSVEMITNAQVLARREDKNKLVESMERIRGYERVPGVIYETLAKAVRQYNARAASGRASVTINPNDPMNALILDQTNSPVNNINPIHALREREVVTYSGRGGRSRRAMVASARLFPIEDLGFMSEGTVDSGDVAIITYLSPNSNLTTTRGTVRMYDAKRDGASCIMSTAAQLSFDAEGDDPKRRNFINVQHGHGIMAEGYEVPAARTGLESVIAARMGPQFAVKAQGKGEITELSDDHITVKYADGTEGRFELGLIHTNAEGSSYPNTLKTTFKLGDKFNEHDILVYNAGFFKPNPTNPARVDYMAGCMARIALREAVYTVEDSCSLSIDFAKRMKTYVSKTKVIVVEFDQGVTNMVKVGQTVDLDTVLCNIRGAISSDDGLYGVDDREVMNRLGAMAPTAGAVGVVAKIEVYYNGDMDDMSDTLQELVVVSEKERRRKARRLGEEYVSGEIPRGVRLGGNALEPHQAAIIVHMTVAVPMGTADKLVIGNQMKSTVGETLFGNNRTLDTHEPIDIIFGAKSPIDRIILGPFSGGSTNTVMRYLGETAYDMYFGND